jgi:hypothetical protein
LADQLRDLADTVQQAGWTPEVIAHVRERYLPGASDDEITARLDRLAADLGRSPLGLRPGTLSLAAERSLTAMLASEAVEQAVTALDAAIDALNSSRHALAGLRGHHAEGERQR